MAAKGLPLPKEMYFKDTKTTLQSLTSLLGVLGTVADIATVEGTGPELLFEIFGLGKAGEALESAETVGRVLHYASEYLDCCARAGAPEAEVLQMRGRLNSISAEVLRDPPSPAPPPSAPPANGLTPDKAVAAIAAAAIAVGVVYHYSTPSPSAGRSGSLPAGFPSIPAGTYDLSDCVAVGAGSYNADTCRSAGVASGDASAIAQQIANTDVCAGISGAQSCSERYTGFNGSEFDVVIDVTSCSGGDCAAGNVVLRVQKAR